MEATDDESGDEALNSAAEAGDDVHNQSVWTNLKTY